jgi:AAA family ATP:ADP antiporter
MLRKLGIEPGEGWVFAWGAAALFLLGWADVSVKKRDRLQLLWRVFLGLAVGLIPLWVLVIEDVKSAFVLLVIASKQLQSISLLAFWVALSDLLNGRQSKRLFAPLMASVTLGTILGSFASEPISRAIGIAGLLPLSAAALAVSAAMTWPLRRQRAGRLERRSRVQIPHFDGEAVMPAGGSMTKLRQLWTESRLFRLLFVMTMCSGLLGPMLYFQFSYVADLATEGAGGEARLMAFYAQFRGWISLGILGVQLGVTSNLYRRIGIPLAVAISPLMYLLGFVGLSMRLSLPAGVGAMAGTKLQDNAIYDPAVRVLFNLFPEDLRARAMTLLEGPVKRAGGALGNVAILAAMGVGTAAWVGGTALPIAAVWLAFAAVLWRAYPALLVQASSRRSRFGDAFDASEHLDSNTLRGLSNYLIDPDPAQCRVALDLVSEAKPEMAAGILAQAVCEAPDATRPLLIPALDRLLERAVSAGVVDAAAAGRLEALLEGGDGLCDGDRADLVRAYGRLTAGIAVGSASGGGVLVRACADPSAAVRLASAAALHRRGTPSDSCPDFGAALRSAIAASDSVLRRTAREECRAFLLCSEPGEAWRVWLTGLAGLLERESDRVGAAEALADVAAHHGEHVAEVSDRVLKWRADADPYVRAAVLRFIGHAGLEEHSEWLVGHLAFEAVEGAELVRAAARDALRALGLRAADALLVELAFGKRSVREAILPLLRDLRVGTERLRSVYDGELDSIRHKLVDLYAAVKEGHSPIVLQRLGERLDEGVHTILQLLAAIHDDDRIGNLAAPLARARGGRQYSILLEALESLLTPSEKQQLMPLLEDVPVRERSRQAARALNVEVPSGAAVVANLLESPDELTRTIAAATLADVPGNRAPLAADAEVKDDRSVLTPIGRAILLRSVPLFEGMTTRQLMHVAEVVEEEDYPPNSVIAREGDHSDCMYIIVEGMVAISAGDELLTQLGANDFFGEIAIFEGGHRTATVAARGEKVVLLRLAREDLLGLMEELPGIAICICQVLSRQVRRLTERVKA